MADSTDSDARPSLVGHTLQRKYQLTRRLGSGGFGDVYEAVHATTGRRVAVKTLHAHLVGHSGAVRRFAAEARASTQIEHDHVVEVFDLDVDPDLGVPYIVQELLTGETLEARLKSSPERRLGPADALRIAVPVMEALVAAHARGIVHRDLKPPNLFLAKNRAGVEVPKVIDFGIAKFLSGVMHEGGTKTGALLGSPSYMSPEQASGEVSLIDAQTDVWAMGVVLYEMLSGRLPYEAPNYQRILGMIQYRDPVPLAERDPNLPGDLVAVISRALTRDRGARYPSMQAFLGALLETSAGGGASQTLPLAAPRVSSTVMSAPPAAAVWPTAPVVSPTLASDPPGKVSTLREGWSKETVQRAPSARSRRALVAVVACVALGGAAAVWALMRPKTVPPAHVAASPPPPIVRSSRPAPEPSAPSVVAGQIVPPVAPSVVATGVNPVVAAPAQTTPRSRGRTTGRSQSSRGVVPVLSGGERGNANLPVAGEGEWRQ